MVCLRLDRVGKTDYRNGIGFLDTRNSACLCHASYPCLCVHPDDGAVWVEAKQQSVSLEALRVNDVLRFEVNVDSNSFQIALCRDSLPISQVSVAWPERQGAICPAVWFDGTSNPWSLTFV